MAVDIAEKLSRRLKVGKAVRLLRQRLGISQERLADMVGEEATAASVSRWERGSMMPYPKTRAKLSEIAMTRGIPDIAGAFETAVSLDDWMDVFEINLKGEYNAWMAFTMCAVYGCVFEPESPDGPTPEEVEIASKYESMLRLAGELLDHLAALHEAGTDFIVAPPHERFRRFWDAYLERRDHAEESKVTS